MLRSTCLAVAVACLALAWAPAAHAEDDCRGGHDVAQSEGHNRGPGGPGCPTAAPTAPVRQAVPAQPAATIAARPPSAAPERSPAAATPPPSPLPTAATRPAEVPAPETEPQSAVLPAVAGLGLILLLGASMLARRRLAAGLSAP